MRPLLKHTIVIWSELELNPVSIEDLASEATDGAAYCSVQRAQRIEDPSHDPDWDGTEFFGVDEEDDEDD